MSRSGAHSTYLRYTGRLWPRRWVPMSKGPQDSQIAAFIYPTQRDRFLADLNAVTEHVQAGFRQKAISRQHQKTRKWMRKIKTRPGGRPLLGDPFALPMHMAMNFTREKLFEPLAREVSAVLDK